MPVSPSAPLTRSRAQRLIAPLRRLIAGWWFRQSPSRQDRLATLGPLISVLLFLAAIISAFWYLRNEEIERETESVKRDTEIAQQQIRLRLIENQEQLVRIAREVVTRHIDAHEFSAQAQAFARDRPELTHVTWLGPKRQRRNSVGAAGFQADDLMTADGEDPSMPMPNQSNVEEAGSQAQALDPGEPHDVTRAPRRRVLVECIGIQGFDIHRRLAGGHDAEGQRPLLTAGQVVKAGHLQV